MWIPNRSSCHNLYGNESTAKSLFTEFFLVSLEANIRTTAVLGFVGAGGLA